MTILARDLIWNASILALLGSAVIGGVFFAFSTFVMKALGRLPHQAGADAMRSINLVVINPVFLGTFLGTALVCAAIVLAAFLTSEPGAYKFDLAASTLYLLGCFAVTMGCNVPLNNRLADPTLTQSELSKFWSIYLRIWTRWNHVRTGASLAACVLFLVSFLKRMD